MSSSNFMESKVTFDFTDSNIYHDKVLVVGERKFYVVSGMLSLWSEHFRGLFAGNFEEASKDEIELKEVDPDALEEFLQIIYSTDCGNLKLRNVVSLVELSYRFLAPKVLEICKEYINSHFGDKHIDKLELLKKACVYEIADLKTKLVKYLMDDKVISQLGLNEVMELVIHYNLGDLKNWIGTYKGQHLTFENCSELLDVAVNFVMPTLKAEISKRISGWDRSSIPQGLIMKLMQAAFKHNIKPLKDKIRECIFYFVKSTEYSHSINVRKRHMNTQYEYKEKESASRGYNDYNYSYDSYGNRRNPVKRLIDFDPDGRTGTAHPSHAINQETKQMITINLFLDTYKDQLLTLPKEMYDFVIASVLSPM